MPHKLPTTHGQSAINVPYSTLPNSVAARPIHPIIARTKPPRAPAAIALLFAVSRRIVKAAGPTAQPTRQPMDTAKRPVKNLETRRRMAPSMLFDDTALFTAH